MKKIQTDKTELVVKKRDVFGKKLKALRADGKLPGNIYGKDFESTAVSLDSHDFSKIFKKVGETQVLYVDLDKKEIPVMVGNVQIHPVTGHFLHVDFKKVDLKKKIEAQVPVNIVGEPEAVHQHIGELHTLIDTLTIEALPSDMPQEIEIDVTGLKEVDDQITVSDLKKSGDFAFMDEPDTVIVKIAEHKEESIEPEVPAEAAEGEASAEGEAPADEEKVEEVSTENEKEETK